MLLLSYSLNLLTLLSLVLAIGLVVDDAIIVVENVHRHIEDGVSPLKAAMMSAKELTKPIVRHYSGINRGVFTHWFYGRINWAPYLRSFAFYTRCRCHRLSSDRINALTDDVFTFFKAC